MSQPVRAGSRVAPRDLARLKSNGIALRTERIARLEGSATALRRIAFETGPALPCDAFFFSGEQVQQSGLAATLGCEIKGQHQVRTHENQRTGVPGLFLAGDADGDVQFVVVAAAEESAGRGGDQWRTSG